MRDSTRFTPDAALQVFWVVLRQFGCLVKSITGPVRRVREVIAVSCGFPPGQIHLRT